MDQPIDDAYILNFLHKSSLGILSTVNAQGLPDAAPLYFITTFAYEIYFITSRGTQKIANLAVKDDVVLTIIDDTKTETVQVRGKAVEAPDKLDETMTQLAAKLQYGAAFLEALPALKYKGQEKIVMKIVPSEIRMRRFTEFAFVEKIVNLPSPA